MERKVNTAGTVLAFATYKPKEGKDEQLLELVKKHLPVLRELELATAKSNFIAISKDGSIIEIFEWTSMNAILAAHQHPAVSDIWEKMALIADFIPMSALPEANKPFPGFEILSS